MRKAFFGICVLVHCSTFGQHVGLRMHETLPQVRSIIPHAQIQDTAYFISIPAATFHVGNSGFSYNDLVKSDGDSAYLDYPDMIGQLRKNNYINADVSLEYLAFGKRFGALQVGFSHTQRIRLYFRYSAEMANFLWYGNSRFIGQTVNLAPDFEAVNYFESRFNASYRYKNWSFGGAVKYLEGNAIVYSEGDEISLTTAADSFDLTLRADFELNSVDRPRVSRIKPFHTGLFKNPGWALDLSVGYAPNDKLSFSASMIDVGRIYWKEKIDNLSMDKSLTFSGVDLSDFILGDSLDLVAYNDSLADFLEIDRDQNPFTSRLVPRIYLMGDYRLTNWKIGAMISLQGFQINTTQMLGSVSLMRTYELKQHTIEPAIHLTYRNRSPYGLGFSTRYRWRYVELYVGGDNVFAWFLPKARVPLSLFDKKNEDNLIIPKQMKTLNFRFAVNFYIQK